jgi:hypothetical protein
VRRNIGSNKNPVPVAGKGCFTINSFSDYSAVQDKKGQRTDTKKPVPAIMKIFRQSGCVLEFLLSQEIYFIQHCISNDCGVNLRQLSVESQNIYEESGLSGGKPTLIFRQPGCYSQSFEVIIVYQNKAC